MYKCGHQLKSTGAVVERNLGTDLWGSLHACETRLFRQCREAKKFYIRKIPNFIFPNLKKKLFKVEFCRSIHKNASDVQTFPPEHQNSTKMCLKCT